jgi:HAD superfamily hydrolase (TIGR01509 family)
VTVHVPPAVLFDMDGLLVDTEPLWTVAEVELAAHLGAVWTDELKAAVVGTRIESAVPAMLRGLGQEPTPAMVADTTARLLARMVELFAGPLTALPGAVDLLTRLRAAGVPVALVSSSYRVLVDAVLTRLGLAFDVTIAGDEVGQAKPHPEPYLTASRLLHVPAGSCVVLEDSPAGVASGEAAGCAVVAVPNAPGVSFAGGPRRLVVGSLAEVDLAVLAELAGSRGPGRSAELLQGRPSAR